jgi:hypothetical protein
VTTSDYRPHLWMIVGLLLWILADVQGAAHHAAMASWGHNAYTALGFMALLWAAFRGFAATLDPKPARETVIVDGEVIH